MKDIRLWEPERSLGPPEKQTMNNKNHTPHNLTRQELKKRLEANPSYVLWPKACYGMGFTKHELLVLLYLLSCVNRERGNTCWPSIKTICRNCSIPSATTVREAIKKLKERGLIQVKPSGRVNIYTIDPIIYLGIDKVNKKDNRISKLEEIGTHSDHIKSEVSKKIPTATHSDGTTPDSDARPHHHVCTNNNKRIKLTKKNKEEKETNKEKDSARGKRIQNAKADKYFNALTEEGKKAFTARADKLSPYVMSSRTRRRRFFEELMEIQADPVFTVPAEAQPASEPMEELH